jgi:hypothetical protein
MDDLGLLIVHRRRNCSLDVLYVAGLKTYAVEEKLHTQANLRFFWRLAIPRPSDTPLTAASNLGEETSPLRRFEVFLTSRLQP